MKKQNPAGSKRPPLAETDRNFDDLAPRFARNVYGRQKGQLRLAILERDFAEQLPALSEAVDQRLQVLDAGGGQGQFSRRFAAHHQLTLCDISAEMLVLARQSFSDTPARYLHASIQTLAEDPSHQGHYHLVLCHAVLEWVVDQQGLLNALRRLLKPDGYLSLTFYNAHGLAFKNLLRGQMPAILTGHFRPHRGSLTPTRPITPAQVLNWLPESEWRLCCHSGIRVFSDYQLTPEGRAMPEDQQLALELRLSRLEPYRSLGRYQHFLLQKIHG